MSQERRSLSFSMSTKEGGTIYFFCFFLFFFSMRYTRDIGSFFFKGLWNFYFYALYDFLFQLQAQVELRRELVNLNCEISCRWFSRHCHCDIDIANEPNSNLNRVYQLFWSICIFSRGDLSRNWSLKFRMDVSVIISPARSSLPIVSSFIYSLRDI